MYCLRGEGTGKEGMEQEREETIQDKEEIEQERQGGSQHSVPEGILPSTASMQHGCKTKKNGDRPLLRFVF